MSDTKHEENAVTLYFAGQQVDDAQDFAIDMDWDDDTTYRFLIQVSVYAEQAAEQYEPEWARR